jgi:hypothetical protein
MKSKSYISRLVGGMILICSLTFALSAQTAKEEVDSLLHILDTKKLSEKEQLEIYRKMHFVSMGWDDKKTFEFAPKGLALAQKRKDVLTQLFL